MKYYLDTSIWRDYYEDRRDNLRPLGEYAFQFLKRVLVNKNQILYSEAVVEELLVGFPPTELPKIFEIVNEVNCLKKVEITQRDCAQARELSRRRKLPFCDALHAILAAKEGAIMITRDHHFQELMDIAPCTLPELAE